SRRLHRVERIPICAPTSGQHVVPEAELSAPCEGLYGGWSLLRRLIGREFWRMAGRSGRKRAHRDRHDSRGRKAISEIHMSDRVTDFSKHPNRPKEHRLYRAMLQAVSQNP